MTVVGRQFVVEGRVQGVGYRAFARRAAIALELRGFAENQADGSVLVEAFGAAEALAAFESALAKGPMAARVDRLSINDKSSESEPPNVFDIR